jgi:CRP-like cAMP-binding protein
MAMISPPPNNRILSALSNEVINRLSPHLVRVPLPAHAVLCAAGMPMQQCHFVDSGLCSLLGTTRDGNSVEVGMIGKEGVVGLPGLIRNGRIHYQVIVQKSGWGLQIATNALRNEFQKCGKLHQLLLAYMQFTTSQMCQSSICNRFHSLKERLCRWLLLTRDRIESLDLHLTQEFLSQMLGSNRTAIAATIGDLQKAEVIRTAQAHIRILNQKAMQSAACECYSVIKEESERFLALL